MYIFESDFLIGSKNNCLPYEVIGRVVIRIIIRLKCSQFVHKIQSIQVFSDTFVVYTNCKYLCKKIHVTLY